MTTTLHNMGDSENGNTGSRKPKGTTVLTMGFQGKWTLVLETKAVAILTGAE